MLYILASMGHCASSKFEKTKLVTCYLHQLWAQADSLSMNIDSNELPLQWYICILYTAQ